SDMFEQLSEGTGSVGRGWYSFGVLNVYLICRKAWRKWRNGNVYDEFSEAMGRVKNREGGW
ncbi:hypothetical protein, partial [Paraclostridium dentum]|uniref:hypothetical protein n=1 Tax=Paraclostridium dentum TaxID=2662455 RepID=UPI003F399477